LALKYFLSTGRRDLAALLYMISCLCDFLISWGHYPTAIALLRGRAPGVFNSIEFCSFWNIYFFLLQKIAIFTVMLLSVSRAIAIVMPFYKVNKRWVLGVLVIYSITLLGFELLGALFKARFVYLSVGPFCLLQPDEDVVQRITLFLALNVGVPSLIMFISFIISVVCLTAQRAMGGTQKQKREASNTIAIFTGCFIFCNFPYCVMLTLENIRIHSNQPYPGQFLRNEVLFWYAWPVSSVIFIALNSAINPILYYMRMSEFKHWSDRVRKLRISQLRQNSNIVDTLLVLKEQGQQGTSSFELSQTVTPQTRLNSNNIDKISISSHIGNFSVSK
jgi:hypothetical protein